MLDRSSSVGMDNWAEHVLPYLRSLLAQLDYSRVTVSLVIFPGKSGAPNTESSGGVDVVAQHATWSSLELLLEATERRVAQGTRCLDDPTGTLDYPCGTPGQPGWAPRAPT